MKYQCKNASNGPADSGSGHGGGGHRRRASQSRASLPGCHLGGLPQPECLQLANLARLARTLWPAAGPAARYGTKIGFCRAQAARRRARDPNQPKDSDAGATGTVARTVSRMMATFFYFSDFFRLFPKNLNPKPFS